MTKSASVDYYDVLGVEPTATESQIRKAWEKRTKATGPGGVEFAALNKAAELLLDAKRRAAYDAERAPAIEEPDLEPGVGVDEVPPAKPRLAKHWLIAVVAGAIVAVIAVGLAVWQGVVVNDAVRASQPGAGAAVAANFNASESDQTAVLETARIALANVLSYNYADMAASQANASRFLTAHAAAIRIANYKRLIDGGKLPGCTTSIPSITASKTVVTTSVVSVGIISVSANKARLGAFVNQETTRVDQAKATTQNRITVSMVKENGKWLVSAIEVPDTDKILEC